MWAYETTFYQIYPLGFCGAPRAKTPRPLPRMSYPKLPAPRPTPMLPL